MFSAAQLNRFAARVSVARFAALPCQMSFRGKTITGSSTAIKTAQKLQEGGFFSSHDAIARIPLSAAPNGVKVGERITLFPRGGPVAGQPMRINEVLNHPNNPEYRLGLACL